MLTEFRRPRPTALAPLPTARFACARHPASLHSSPHALSPSLAHPLCPVTAAARVQVPHPAYKRYNKLPLGFTLVHYAGEVVYDATGFLEKNKDRGPVDALPLLRASNCALVRVAFAPTKAEQAAMSAKKGARFAGVVAKFSTQLGELSKHLKQSQVRMIAITAIAPPTPLLRPPSLTFSDPGRRCTLSAASSPMPSCAHASLTRRASLHSCAATRLYKRAC